jgi:hypothetical protein
LRDEALNQQPIKFLCDHRECLFLGLQKGSMLVKSTYRIHRALIMHNLTLNVEHRANCNSQKFEIIVNQSSFGQ